MIRIPLGNEASSRLEVRTVAPDANPYLAFYVILKTGFEGSGIDPDTKEKRPRTRFLPDNINDAIRLFKQSEFMTEILGSEVKDKFIKVKRQSAHRCPRELGNIVKTSEVFFHHEVTNQYLWSKF